MKRFGTIALIAGLLLGVALFYRLQPGDEQAAPAQTDDAEASILPGVKLPNAHKLPVVSDKAEGLLTLRADSSHGYLMSDEAAQGAEQEIFASVDVTAELLETAERPPLNIALAIDRSGSMEGEKMRYAKEAAIALVDQLGPDDRLALVSYATDVTLMYSSHQATEDFKAEMREAIQGLRAAGGTNISGGYVEAFKQVRDFVDDRAVSRVILVSDGEANIGLTSPQALRNLASDYRRRGVSLTTIGVGLDYNEDVMAGMADDGAGNYYFVDDALSAVRIFETEMQRLGQTVAKNTGLVMTLGEGVELDQLFGFSHEMDGDKIVVSLAEFRGGDNKNLLLKLRVNPAKAGKSALLRADLGYRAVGAQNEQSSKVELSFVRTDSAQKLDEMVNLGVIERVEQVRVADAMQRAMTAYGAGRDEEARQQLDLSREQFESTRTRYKIDTKGADAARDRLEQSIEAVKRPAPSAEARIRAAKRVKETGRNMQKAANIDLW